MAKRPILVVMAAGMGSRYGGLKQIDPVGPHGEVIIDYSIYDAKRAGFKTVVFIIKHEFEEEFKEVIGSRMEKHMEVRYAFQQLDDLPEGYSVPEGRAKPWGTSHAIMSARDMIDAPFAVINADDYYGPEAFKEIYNYMSQGEDGEKYRYAMVGYLLQNTVTEHGTVARGLCEVNSDGTLKRVTERTKIGTYEKGIHYTEDGGESWVDVPRDTVVSMNLWGFTPSFVTETCERFKTFLDDMTPEESQKKEYFLPSVVTQLLEEKKAEVQVLKSHDKWYGVTYKEDKLVVVQAIRDKIETGIYPEKLWEE